jgi:hypothetical protein
MDGPTGPAGATSAVLAALSYPVVQGAWCNGT